MLRLDLDDNNKTVLFIDPMKEVKIRKEKTGKSIKNCYELCIETGYGVTYAVYYTESSRDAAYERILNKINKYLFPQKECFEEFVRRDKELGPICPNDFAVPKKEEMDEWYQS